MNTIIKRIVLIGAYMLAAGFGFTIASFVVLYLPDPAREARGHLTSKLFDDVMQSYPPDSSDTILFFVPSEANKLFGMITKADFLSVA
ncbi:MAG: hypothetical protein K2X81_17005, partial [Candidatus Obscuribacterales bacterium]|nr:hypothetical protein [Candidatus Obscuribacterales bacterium]